MNPKNAHTRCKIDELDFIDISYFMNAPCMYVRTEDNARISIATMPLPPWDGMDGECAASSVRHLYSDIYICMPALLSLLLAVTPIFFLTESQKASTVARIWKRQSEKENIQFRT